jgi:uncharacterized membrane protein
MPDVWVGLKAKVFKIGIAASIMAIAVYVLNGLYVPETLIERIANLSLLVLVGVSTYFAIVMVTGVMKTSDFKRIFKKN